MKKNLFSILLVVVMTLAMVACGTQETTNDVPVSTETIEATVESDENSEAVSETEQATEAPVDEVVETVDETVESESSEATSETESDEVASTPDSEAVESEASEPETSEPEFTVTEVTATKYATQSVNVRSGPSTDYNKIGGLTTNQEVQVTGQASTGWYRFTWTDGREAYVSDKYLSDSKVEKPAASETPSNGGGSTANSGSAASNSSPYTLWQPVDEGSKIWWYVTQPDPNWETSGHKETQAWMMDTICDRGVANSGGFVPEGYYGYAANEWIFMGTYSEGNVYYQSFYYATISQSLVN